MKLSAPIYHLKRQAKILSRKTGVPLHEALNSIATDEGFAHWSLLAAQHPSTKTVRALLNYLSPGDLLLLGARPGHGKTLLSLELTVEAMKAGRHGIFYTLEYNGTDVLTLFKNLEEDPKDFEGKFELDVSDTISADYIIEQLSEVPAGTIVVIDYLQLLDQKRENPELMIQIRALKSFAKERGLIMVFISQIDRSFDLSLQVFPSLEDVRLPNPLDLKLFDKVCFLNDGEIQISETNSS